MDVDQAMKILEERACYFGGRDCDVESYDAFHVVEEEIEGLRAMVLGLQQRLKLVSTKDQPHDLAARLGDTAAHARARCPQHPW